MLRDMLTLTTVQVQRDTITPDGMGGSTTTSVLTTLSRSQIWQAGNSNPFISDKITNASTHVLAIETGAYTFIDDDAFIIHGSTTYKTVGHADDVAQQGEITILGLEWFS